MRIELVNQDNDVSCALACIAMLTGEPLEKIRHHAESVFGIKPPVKMKDVVKLLTYYNFFCHQTPAYEPLYTGYIYLLSVRSLNTTGVHSILLDARETKEIVYDPQKGVKGKRYYSDSNDLNYLDALKLIDIFEN